MNNFLFIIPLTPDSILNEERIHLRKLCFDALINQSYGNWQALLIGESSNYTHSDPRFIKINFEGKKEEKLQIATAHILTQKIQSDYLIRLDDDDIINPNILEKLKTASFDVYSDCWHSFFHMASGKISQQVRVWFPNTCIQKTAHALTIFGEFPKGEITHFKPAPYLIENDHSSFHKYYTNRHNVLFSQKKNPIYLRAIGSSSITAKNANDYNQYLQSFGYWKSNRLTNFSFLNTNIVCPPPTKQNLITYFEALLLNIKLSRNYLSVLLSKS